MALGQKKFIRAGGQDSKYHTWLTHIARPLPSAYSSTIIIYTSNRMAHEALHRAFNYFSSPKFSILPQVLPSNYTFSLLSSA